MANLIPDESLALVGQALGEPLRAMITEDAAQRFALAVDDRNPIYFDDDAAREAGYRGRVVPPAFLGWALQPARPLDDLREDGLYRGSRFQRGVPLRVKRMMFGGEDWTFHAPVYPGDTITSESRLESLEEKQGSSGPFVLQTTLVTYTNQEGVCVAEARTRGIAR